MQKQVKKCNLNNYTICPNTFDNIQVYFFIFLLSSEKGFFAIENIWVVQMLMIIKNFRFVNDEFIILF